MSGEAGSILVVLITILLASLVQEAARRELKKMLTRQEPTEFEKKWESQLENPMNEQDT